MIKYLNKKTVKLVFQNNHFKIPNFQRPFKWTKSEAEQLLDDIDQAKSDYINYFFIKYQIGNYYEI